MITPLYDHNGIRIFAHNVGDWLVQAGEPIDCVITDPPYHLRRAVVTLDEETDKEARTVNEASWFIQLSAWYQAWLALLQPRLAGGPAWIFADMSDYAGVMLRSLKIMDWPIQRIWSLPGQEILILAGKQPITDAAAADVQAALSRHGAVTVKPVELIAALLKASDLPTSALICDPFMGDGSTLVAAKQGGYRAVGIEYRDARCATAIQALARLATEVMPVGRCAVCGPNSACVGCA